MNELLSAALQWAEWGWEVFPLQDRGKGPRSKQELHTEDGKGGFYVATVNPAQIRAWWQRWPRANVGIRTGRQSNIFAIDIDVKDGKDGEAVWRGICSQHAIPDTVEVLTATGGRHLYFTMPDAALSIDSEGQLGEGVEYRGEGGYVVAPPSVTDQGTYQWELSSDPYDTTLAALPQSLLSLLTDRLTKKEEESYKGFDGWLAAIGDHAAGEGFHKAVVRAAASYAGRYGRALTDRDYLIWRITQRVQEAPWSGDRQALDRRIKTEIPSAVDSALAKFGDKPHEATPSKPTRRLERATDLLARYIPPPVELAGRLLHEGMYLFSGKSKRGKSALILSMAVQVALGQHVLGHFPSEPSPVLYMALEDGDARVKRRLEQWYPDHETMDNLWLAYEYPTLGDGFVEALTEDIQAHEFRMVVVDVLAKIHPQLKKDGASQYQEIYAMMGPIIEMVRAQNICFIMLSHLRKSEAEDIFDAMHGSVAYQGAQEVLWVMDRPMGDDTAKLYVRDKDYEDTIVGMREHGGLWSYLGEGEEFDLGDKKRAVREVIRDQDRELKIDELMKLLNKKQSEYGGFARMLQRMVRDNELIRTDHGRYGLKWSPYPFERADHDERF